MKKITLFLILSFSILNSQFSARPVLAQDAPNINVTKRRPDRPVGYSPAPSPTIQPVEVKQVEPASPSFFARLWTWLKSLFTPPIASTTSASPTPTASTDQISNWKTYPDATIIGLPYLFKYPTSVEISEAGDFVYLKIGNSEIRHRFVAKTKNISSLMGNYQPFASPKIIFSSKVPITIGLLNGYQTTTIDGMDTYLFLGNDSFNGILVFSYPSANTELKSALNQILQTFKFTN